MFASLSGVILRFYCKGETSSHFIEPVLDLGSVLAIREVLNNNSFKLLKTEEVLPEGEDFLLKQTVSGGGPCI